MDHTRPLVCTVPESGVLMSAADTGAANKRIPETAISVATNITTRSERPDCLDKLA
jgi:hypothetical protein